MPTYVVLLRNSERGALQMIGTGAAGAEDQNVAVKAYGGSVKCQYALSGRYDTLLVVDFPDDVHIFEMPLLGFLGYPPFGLELYALLHLIALRPPSLRL